MIFVPYYGGVYMKKVILQVVILGLGILIVIGGDSIGGESIKYLV